MNTLQYSVKPKYYTAVKAGNESSAMIICHNLDMPAKVVSIQYMGGNYSTRWSWRHIDNNTIRIEFEAAMTATDKWQINIIAW